MLTREQILALDDLSREKVDVPEWGTSVYVRVLNGTEITKALTEERTLASMVAMFTVDEKGARLFTDEDVAALARKNYKALNRIASAGMRFNALTAEGQDDAKKDSPPGEPAAI